MKKFLYIIIIIGIISLNFYSCKEKENTIIIAKTINFKTDLVDIKSSFIGTYFDKIEQKDIIYFVNPKTCIKRYYLSGELFDTVPLNKTIDFLKINNDKIRIITAYSSDTIMILSDYNNFILSINGKGKIFNIKLLDEILADSLKTLVGIDNCWTSNSNSDYNNLFFNFYPMQEYYEKYCDINDTLNPYEKILITNKIDFEIPYLLNLKNLYSDNLQYNLIVTDYAKRNYKENEFLFRFNDFKIINNKIFILPWETNIISEYNIDTYQHIKEIKIESKYTDIGFKILTVEEIFNQNNDQNNSGKIHYLYYSNRDKKYYIIVSHTVKEEIEDYKYIPFSIITYDENFNNPKEYKFNKNTYSCRKAFMTTEGLIIQRKPEKLTKENYGTQTFDLLELK